MAIKLNYGAAKLLKHTLSFTGQKEVNEQGMEVPSRRRLSNEESCQRRFFTKAIEPMIQEIEDLKKEYEEKFRKKYNEKIAAERKKREEKKGKSKEIRPIPQQVLHTAVMEDEELLAIQEEVNEKLKPMLEKEHKLDITDKTKQFCKKYFDLFGEEVGYSEGDDESVEMLMDQLS